ncbi:1,4-alpha-glucan-branching enzyme 2-1, chloroplastic/amyloplastic-like [Syzygium oleosum]|uniref:1,4-alpha-glucan-branching enzyme 2-1, chloroplastic/amyloplastic-like n=1 Tax=Syzygium oleosum TaxID=219896 RepID=UPI0011D227B8|nr:1,4-alpha-glucan-branching enzyme 2-1, chloroplastic/amyloplastic-like [Syzygium oleosum]
MTGFHILHVKLTWCLFVGKIFAGKSSYDSDTSSLSTAASERVPVPGGYSDVATSSTDRVETSEAVTDSQMIHDSNDLTMEAEEEIEVTEKQDSVS